MRICLVTHRYPPQSGGVETHVEAVATRFVDRGHDVTVVAADAGGDGARRERRDGVRVRRVRAFAPGDNLYVAPGVVGAVRRCCRSWSPDVVHVHNYHAVPFALGGLTAAHEGVPVVATPHYHGGSDDALRDRLLAVYRPLGAATLRRAAAVLPVGDWERQQLAADFGVDGTVVPNGVVRERFQSATPVSTDRPYLLSVGRLEAYKGVQHAVAALAALPGYELRVAGTGPYRESLAERARAAGVADRVEFLGYVDDERLPGLYAGAAATVALSTHEAYGLTVAESLAAGTAAVVRTAAALSDWTSDDGVVGVSEVDPSTVAEAVRAAVDGPAPDPTAVPTWAETTDRLLAVYRDSRE